MKEAQRKNIICLNGRFREADQAVLVKLTPGRVEQKGVFETMRSYNGKVFGLEAHLNRMERGLQVYGHNRPLNRKKINQIIADLLQANDLKDAKIRISSALQGRSVMQAVVCAPIKKNPDSVYRQGYKLVSCALSKPRTKFSNVKSLEYGFFLKAYESAVAKGYDETVIVDPTRHVLEGSRTNIFCVRKGCLQTPPVFSGCLNGVTRQMVFRLAKALNLPCEVRKLQLKDLLMSREVFLTNSVIEIMPVRSLDRKKIPVLHERSVACKLLSEYRKRAGSK